MLTYRCFIFIFSLNNCIEFWDTLYVLTQGKRSTTPKGLVKVIIEVL